MSNIEWTDETWNPVVGCTPVSPGCLNCYAARMAIRQEAMGTAAYQPVLMSPRMRDEAGIGDGSKRTKEIRIAEVRGGRPVFTGSVRLVPDALDKPLHWRKPRRIFVNSMSDLFHEAVPDQFIRRVVAVMSFSGQHTYQVLTKRPDRMAAWFANPENSLSACQAEYTVTDEFSYTPSGKRRPIRGNAINGTRKGLGDGNYWPLPNLWLGTSVEDQARADERIPHLLKCPAAVRFLSVEPLLGAVDLLRVDAAGFGGPAGHKVDCIRKGFWSGTRWGFVNHTDLHDKFGPLHWLIVGGESGPGARPCNVEWIRSIVGQCKAAGVSVFVKQLGANVQCRNDQVSDWLDECGLSLDYIDTEGVRMQGDPVRVLLNDPKGGDPSEWPDDLRVREMPGDRA